MVTKGHTKQSSSSSSLLSSVRRDLRTRFSFRSFRRKQNHPSCPSPHAVNHQHAPSSSLTAASSLSFFFLRPHNNDSRTADCFVNSQEWTLPRTVSEVRLAVVGSRDSAKSRLVHRYLTGRCSDQEEGDEEEDGEEGGGGAGGGGRFKKEVSVDGHSHLLLIRDEEPAVASGHLASSHQLSGWMDALLIVFALDSESSFALVPALFHSLLRRGAGGHSPTPVLLIGTQVQSLAHLLLSSS